MRDLITAQSRLRTTSSLQGARFARTISIFALGWVFCASGYAQDHACRVIPAGRDFWIRLTDPVSTYSSKIGATVKAILIASPNCDDSAAFATGTIVQGHIIHIRRVGLGVWHSSSAVTIDFDKVIAGPQTFAVKVIVEEVANGRENVKAGVIKGADGRATPQQVMSTRLLHLPFWNTEAYWIFLLRRGTFPFSPEPEIFLPAGTDLRLRLVAPVELPAEFVKARQEENMQHDAEIDEHLREKLVALPARSLTRSGRPSDVVNLAFLGSPQQIEAAFRAAGWTYGDSVSAWSILREMRAFSSLNSYAHLPISNQWLAGKASDIRLQKSLDSYQKRDHIRIWNENALAPDLWAGSAIHETGATWSIRTGRFIHHVDADIDAESERVVRDLTLTGCVADVYRVQRPEKSEPAKNATGDELWTDGSLEILKLSACETPAITAIPLSNEIAWRPRSKLKRLARAQMLSIHDLWRSNAIYASFDISRAVIHSLRHRHVSEYQTKASH
jgi:LssY-like putative type I secretion system component LssY